MKAWIAGHKLYLAAAALLVIGSMYYVFMYQPGTSRQQVITGVENNTLSNETKDNEKVSNQTEQTKQENKQEVIVVDVKGAIKQPGVYPSNQNERVIDVIQRAGGLTDNADQSQVNFAAHVQDEMVIYIPAKGEVTVSSPSDAPVSTGVKNSSGANAGKININKANENELQNLPGIGPAKATAIVQYRQENGLFKNIEDLKKISGIGDKTFEKLQELISVQ